MTAVLFAAHPVRGHLNLLLAIADSCARTGPRRASPSPHVCWLASRRSALPSCARRRG